MRGIGPRGTSREAPFETWFPETRIPDEEANVLDHFYLKLFRLADTMNTVVGRAEAWRRTAFMHEYLRQLGKEIQVGYELEERA